MVGQWLVFCGTRRHPGLAHRLAPLAPDRVFASVGTPAGDGANPAAEVCLHLAEKRVAAEGPARARLQAKAVRRGGRWGQSPIKNNIFWISNQMISL